MRSRRPDRNGLLGLIGMAYAASENPVLWDRLLQCLAEAINGRGAALLHHDLRSSGTVSTSVRVDPAALRLYDQHFNRLDPWAAGASGLSVGTPASDELLIPRADLQRSEYFNDFAVKYDVSRLLTVVLERGKRTNSVLSVLRGERDAPFTLQDQEFLQALTPHLQRALQIHQRLQRAEQERAAAVDALDALRRAVFFVDSEARVVLTNRRGREMLAACDGISIDRGRLCAASPADTKALREACAVVAVTRAVLPRHAGAALTLGNRPSEGPPLQVLVTPTTSTTPLGLEDPRVAALVFVSDPADGQRPSATLLRQFYGLTPAECHVAACIAVGWSLEEIAADRGSAIETVRRQSKQILAKTGARNRSELVRWLTTTLPELAADDGRDPSDST